MKKLLLFLSLFFSCLSFSQYYKIDVNLVSYSKKVEILIEKLSFLPIKYEVEIKNSSSFLSFNFDASKKVDFNYLPDTEYYLNIKVYEKESLLESQTYKFIILENPADYIFAENDMKFKLNKKFHPEGYKILLVNLESLLKIQYSKKYQSSTTALKNTPIFPIGFNNQKNNDSSYMKTSIELRYNNFGINVIENDTPLISPEICKDNQYYYLFPNLFKVYPILMMNNDIEITINIHHKKIIPCLSFAELWKMKPYMYNLFDSHKKNYLNLFQKNYRIPELNVEKKPFIKEKNAIIFVHGIQLLFREEKRDKDFVWSHPYRYITFNQWYKYIIENYEKFEDCDFFEFIYDSHVMTYEEYGKKLYDIMKLNGFFDKNGYKNIYLVGHSMGGLVIRSGMNNEYNSNVNIITLNAVNEGSPLQNVPELFNINLHEKNTDISDVISQLYQITELIGKSYFISGINLEDTIKTILKTNPLFFPVILSELNLLDTFKGGFSIRYSNKEYLDSLEKNLFNYPDYKIFTINESINNLNNNYLYYDKTLCFYTRIKEYDYNPALFFTYNTLNMLGNLAETKLDNLFNDGCVPLSSQMLESYNAFSETIDKSIHHGAVFTDNDVIKKIMEYIYQKKKAE